jgi:hypothetical protein
VDLDLAKPSGPEAPGATRPARDLRRRAALLAFAGAALVGGAWFVAAWSGRGAEPASVDDAVEEFRRDHATADAGAGILRPVAGVYTYAAAGTERLSFLDTTQRWGDTMPATVAHTGECWRLRIEYSSHHWQEWDLCPVDGRLEESGGRTFQSFDFVVFSESDTVEFTCDPRGVVVRTEAAAGETWEQTCSGSGTRGTTTVSSGTNTYVGLETVRIGARNVEAYRYRSERVIGGDQQGAETFESWYATTDGMLLRGTRALEVRSPSPIGDVTYTEVGSFVLTALEPAR